MVKSIEVGRSVYGFSRNMSERGGGGGGGSGGQAGAVNLRLLESTVSLYFNLDTRIKL